MRAWKILGLAGLAGVAIAGTAAGVSHVQRTKREYADADADELRERLQQRFAALAEADQV